jgi:hypothetical protein
VNKHLLIEHSIFTPTRRVLSESTSNGAGNMLVSGLVQACDKPNANKRIYPYETLKLQVDTYIEGPIAENRALGELDHPESSVINLKNVSHNIVKLWWEGKNLYGDIEILPTPSGNILKQLFQNNITVGISSRAMGSVTPIGEGLVQVEKDLELICWDFVSTPSTFGAYVRPIQGAPGLQESYNPNYTIDKYSKANRLISDIICTMGGYCCIK